MGIITYEFLIGIPPFTSDTAEQVFDNILHQDLEWPEDCTVSGENQKISLTKDDAKDFVERLLQRDPNRRLGMTGGGANDVMAHPFFRGIHWDSLLEQTPVFMPKPDHKEDTFYFDGLNIITRLTSKNVQKITNPWRLIFKHSTRLHPLRLHGGIQNVETFRLSDFVIFPI